MQGNVTCPPFPCTAWVCKWQIFSFPSFQPYFISHGKLNQVALYLWYPVTVFLIGQWQSLCETTHLNLSLHHCPCPDEGILWSVPSAATHCIAQGAAVRSWRQRMLFLVLHFKCEPFFLPPNLCALSDHVSKRQWISAFKTLPQKVVGFLDKEAGRKNLFHFKSLKIKILSNYVASFSCCCYLSCSRGLFWLHLARDARKLSPALVCEGPRECQKEDDHDGCPPSPGASRLPPGTEFQMVTTGDLLFI